MIMQGWRFFASRQMAMRSKVLLYIAKCDYPKPEQLLSPEGGFIQLKESDDFAPGCAFVVHEESAQELMDGLWRCGLRPTEGAGSAGSLAATERHLADLQRLVFERKGTEP